MKANMTLPEAVEYSGIAKTRLYELLRSGKIPSVKLGKSWKIRAIDIDMYMAELKRVQTEKRREGKTKPVAMPSSRKRNPKPKLPEIRA